MRVGRAHARVGGRLRGGVRGPPRGSSSFNWSQGPFVLTQLARRALALLAGRGVFGKEGGYPMTEGRYLRSYSSGQPFLLKEWISP